MPAAAEPSSPAESHDIIVLGAGLSGINTAHTLRQRLPHRRLTILEARPVLGGTWSFFRYPGFRSDSYMTTFGLQWHPWPHRHKMAAAPQILEYLEDAVDADGLRSHIRFNHKVVGCEWRSSEQQWRLTVEVEQHKTIVIAANFVIGCTGYYAYDRAFEAAIPGISTFNGQVIHPQWWPDIDVSGKRVVVVGSGATAVTVVPNLVDKAASVTMLQRSPSYVASRPTTQWVDDLLRMLLPLSWAFWLSWWKDTLWELFITEFLLLFPGFGRWALMSEMKSVLPPDVDVDVHFNPRYGPFQQRLCLCPEGDFFKALRRDNCEIVTDVVETVTGDGILLKSGRKLEADIIVTATGLYFQLLSGMKPVVDGQVIVAGEHCAWRGCMLDSLPNMAFVMGYVTSSWTPGADIMGKIIVRVLAEMERTGSSSVMPVFEPSGKDQQPLKLAVDTTSNYFVKAADRMPKVTGQGPWYGRKNLAVDLWAWCFGSMTEGMRYTLATASASHKKDL